MGAKWERRSTVSCGQTRSDGVSVAISTRLTCGNALDRGSCLLVPLVRDEVIKLGLRLCSSATQERPNCRWSEVMGPRWRYPERCEHGARISTRPDHCQLDALQLRFRLAAQAQGGSRAIAPVACRAPGCAIGPVFTPARPAREQPEAPRDLPPPGPQGAAATPKAAVRAHPPRGW